MWNAIINFVASLVSGANDAPDETTTPSPPPIALGGGDLFECVPECWDTLPRETREEMVGWLDIHATPYQGK